MHSLRNLRLPATALLLASGAFGGTLTYEATILSTNFVTGDVGMRNIGSGNLAVNGIPIGSTVTQSLLFWHGPTNSADPTVNSNVTVAGKSVTGTNIGFASDNFWSSLNSQAYTADVTGIINGNGSYGLSGFEPANTLINGAADFTFYNSGLSTGQQDVILYQGNDSNFDSPYDVAGWNFTANNINYNGGPASLTLYVSDGQNFGSNDDGTLTVNGQTLATGGIFQGLAPAAAGAGVSNGDLTDVLTFNLTPYLTVGTNSLNIQLGAGVSDAVSLVAAAFAVPAGDAPITQVVAPEPGTFVLSGLSLLLALLFRLKFSGSWFRLRGGVRKDFANTPAVSK